MTPDPTTSSASPAAHVFTPRAAGHLLVLLASAETDLQRGIERARREVSGVDLAVAVTSDLATSARAACWDQGIRAVIETGGAGPRHAAPAILGFARADGYDAVVAADGGGGHGFDAVPAAFAALEMGADFVMGSGYAPGGRIINDRIASRAAVRIGAVALWSATGLAWSDPVCSFRAYGRRLLAAGDSPACGTGFLVWVARRGFRVAQIPLTRRRECDESAIRLGAGLARALARAA